MPKVNVTIDGTAVSVEAKSTVLDAANAAGVYIPTLCHHPALKPTGNCRMCLIEIERQRGLQAACVFPVSEGMVVHTNSPKVIEARRFVLELTLSDHAFYCMYCEMSGDCELQTLAYRYGIDKVPYPYGYPWEPVDASREYFVYDSKRCILCRRCVRACDEVVANHTLGIEMRGFGSKVIADLDVPFGESSCISCGTCLQVCPTGALTDRKSSYMGRASETQRTKSICSACGVGCGVEVISRSNNILRVEGDWEAGVNKGLLCVRGRFDQINIKAERFMTPVIRQDGKPKAANWDDALKLVAAKLRAAGPATLGVVSPKATSEVMQSFAALMNKLGSKNLGVTVVKFPALPAGAKEGAFSDILDADIILLVSADLTQDHQVLGSFVRRALDSRTARLIIVDDLANGFSDYAYLNLKPGEEGKAVELALRAQKPVVLYGTRTANKTLKALEKLTEKALFISLVPGANTRGAYQLGFGDVSGAAAKAAIVWATDDLWPPSPALLDILKKAEFVVVQSAYPTPLTELADVILPAAIWAEKEGTITSAEGRTQKIVRVVEPCGQVWDDEAILKALSGKLG
jgi:formate dehydrogenase major subunit